GGTASGGTVSIVNSQGGEIALMTNVTTGDITAESDIGRINTDTIRADAYADADASAIVAVAADVADNNGDGGTATGGIVGDIENQEGAIAQGGEIIIRTDVTAGNIRDASKVGQITINRIDSSADARAGAVANASDDGNSGSARGGTGSSEARGGSIVLRTNLQVHPGHSTSNLGTIQINSRIDTSTRALADAGATGQLALPGSAMFSAFGGPIRIDSDGAIRLSEEATLNTSAGTFSFSSVTLNPDDSATLNGGNIRFVAKEDILLNQISAETNAMFDVDGEIRTANVLASSAGSLTVQTPRTIRLQDNVVVSVESTGLEGQAGDINFVSRSLLLGEQSSISSKTDSGDGGNITIDLIPNFGDLLLLSSGSSISTTAGTNQQGGDGGDITTNARIIATSPRFDSDITANAFTGSGGNITITTDGLFGIEFRENQTPLSDITASSQFGLNGTVTVNTPGIDPSRGLGELPVEVIDAPPLDAICSANTQRQSQFIQAGRGGLPTNPTDSLNGSPSSTPWVTRLTPESTQSTPPAPLTQSPPHTIPTLTEAQGWTTHPNGTITLIATHPQTTPQESGQSPQGVCHP
ncbi:MAG: hypothetical protein AAGD25_21225, partial [Cyanobacteria bacterium P01_F01_bin.150]